MQTAESRSGMTSAVQFDHVYKAFGYITQDDSLTMRDVEITTSEGDPAEGTLWTNAYNNC
ncbi:MAG: hypothetical protein QOI36_4171 [Pseudonocardiales bacterium]|jgi:hypothetical protein|nr:hypothetical protein [Pseudonocardia sp.]MDT7652765.1 hypothetical protein [Pseudonocardiales bacterium]